MRSNPEVPDGLSTTAPTYGQSQFYLGESGRSYFSRQGSCGISGGELEARKLGPFIGKARSVLDFGCGGGFLIEALRRTVPVVCGIEPNPVAREACTRRGLEVHESISDVTGRTFDAVVSNHCLEHVPYPIDALRSLREVIACSGVLVLALPIDDWRVQRRISEPDKDHHLHTWTPVLIRNTLHEAGYVTVSASVLSYAWPRHWQHLYPVLPAFAFDSICRLWSVVARRRQLLAIARPR